MGIRIDPKGDGVALLYTSIVLLAVSWITFVARIGVRVWRKCLGLDDGLMGAGLLLFTITASLCISCSFLGSGQLAANIPPITRMQGIKQFFIAEFFYAYGAVAIKCSIAVTLLRIADSRKRFVYTIWAIMIATWISCLVFVIGVANICHPITTLWGETTTGSCDVKLNSDVSFFFSAIEIATDWSLAILPAVLLWNIQMKKRVKGSVAVILGLAAFASCATIVRLRYLSLYSNPTEFMLATGKVGLWSIIEEGIGVSAGSMPALRPLLGTRLFGGSGSNSKENTPAATSGFKESRNKSRQMGRQDVTLDTFHELRDADGAGMGDADSQKYILKETSVVMSSRQGSTTPGEWERNQVLGWNQSKSEA